jgi:hypothetical protein
MITIYKYKLSVDTVQAIELPTEAEILSAGAQGKDIYIWVLVDPESPKKSLRRIHVYPTGQEMKADMYSIRFLGTVTFDSLVFHVFEEYI